MDNDFITGMMVGQMMNQQKPEPTCPECGKTGRKVVCVHCGIEITEEEFKWRKKDTVILICVIIGIWAFFTILLWVIGDMTLVEVLQKQWEWISGIPNSFKELFQRVR